jgi:hypothetical protein
MAYNTVSRRKSVFWKDEILSRPFIHMKTIAVVNQYYPPDKASTGWIAKELVDELRDRLPDWKIIIIATDATYKGGIQVEDEILDQNVIRIKSYTRFDNKLYRLIGSLYEGRQLAKKATATADIVISMTNPPLVNYWMGRYAKTRKRRWVEWTLDLFPEAFSSAGLVSEKSPIYRYFLKHYAANYPDYNLFLGPLQRDFVYKTHRFKNQHSILTCGIKEFEKGPIPEWRSQFSEKIVIGYIGNLGEAHSAESVATFVKAAEYDNIQFLFSIYGAKADLLKSLLKEQKNVTWTEGIPDSELPWLDVQLVSLLPTWTHICVPSKGVSAICAGNPIIYIGLEQADIYQFFKEAAWLIREEDSLVDTDIQSVIKEIANPEILNTKKAATSHFGEQQMNAYKKGIEELVEWISKSH